MPIAQATTDIGRILPSIDWWMNWGVLGVLVFVVLFVALYAAREWWSTYKPHYVAKKQAELMRDEKLTAFIDQLSESHGEEIESKRQVAEAMRTQTALLTKMDNRAEKHADACDDTHRLVKDIHQWHRERP